MEGQSSSPLSTATSVRSEVDTSRPFRSVREAVAVFGERILVGNAYSQKSNAVTTNTIYSATRRINSLPTPKPTYAVSTPKPLYSACSSPPSFSSSSSHFNQDSEGGLMILSSLKKLEAELEETKQELRLLKERESEREVAVASLNAELHKNMSKLAEIEAAGAAKAVKRSLSIEEHSPTFEYLPSFAEALDMNVKFGGRKKTKASKRKPIVPLLGDIFFRKKVSADFDNSLYTYSIH